MPFNRKGRFTRKWQNPKKVTYSEALKYVKGFPAFPPKRRTARTRRVIPRKSVNVNSQGTGIASNSNYKVVRKAKPTHLLLKKIGSPFIAVSQFATQTYSQGGFQQWGGVNFLSRQAMNALGAKVPVGGAIPNGGSNTQANYGNIQATNNFLFESAYGELTFTNATNHAVGLNIYEVVCKRDTQVAGQQLTYNLLSPPGAVYQLGMTSNTLTWRGPLGALEAGLELGQQTANPVSYPTNSGIANMNLLGSGPKDSRTFNQWYTITKKVNVQMPLGATHRHKYSYKMNKLIDQSIFGNPQLDEIKGLTRHLLWCVYGYPANYNEDASGASSQVTSTPCLLNVIATTRMKYTYVHNNQSVIYYQDGLTSLANTDVINVGNGQIETAVNTSPIFNYGVIAARPDPLVGPPNEVIQQVTVDWPTTTTTTV